MKWTVLLLSVAAVSAYSAIYRDLEQEWKTLKLENKYEEYQSSEEGCGVGMNTITDKSLQELPDPFLSKIQGMNGFYVDRVLLTSLDQNSVEPLSIQAGALEGQHFFKTKELRSLSAQNLIDCTHIRYGDKNVGCENGGHPSWAFNYVAANGGINSAKYYPYEGLDRKCRYESKYAAATAQGFVRLPSGNEDCLKRMLVEVGPISVAIDGSLPSFNNYRKGVYYDRDCTTKTNRWVLLVGYGTGQPGGDFWVIKNSWGTDWGMDGYMKLARNRGNHCGIASNAIYPIV